MALVLCAWAVVARAAEAPLRLEPLVQEARERNPELLAARGRSQVAAAMPRQASAWDDPTLTWEAWNAPDSFRVDRADNNIFRLSQKIPFPGKRRLAGEIATLDADRARYEAGSVELDLVAAVKRAYWDLWQTHARLDVLGRDKALVERFTKTVEQKYGTDEATQADVLRAQVELTHMTNQIQTEQLAVRRAEAELNALLSRSPSEPLGTPESPGPPRLDADPAELADTALAHRPDLAAQGATIAREETAVKLAQRGYYPDFEVSVGRFVNFDQADGFGAMASVTLPIFNTGKYAAAVDEASARLGVARSERRRLEDRLRRDVEQAYLQAKTSLLQFELFEHDHIPQAEQALRVSESGYETGTVRFLDLIDTVRSIQSVHLEHIAAQTEFEKAYAELERVVGVELPREPARRGAHG